MACMCWSSLFEDIFRSIRRFELPALVHSLRERTNGFTHRHKGYWLDIGRPDDYQRAQDDFPTMRAAAYGGKNARLPSYPE